MSSHLPDFVDPWRLAERGKGFSGQIELARLPRLAEALASPAGHADFDVPVGWDGEKWIHITGTVRARLALKCQRCLEQMNQAVDVAVNLVVIEVQEQAALLSEDVDPVLAEEGQISLMDLIEDELLLSIPQVPRHAPELCRVDPADLESVNELEDTMADPTPFAVLEGLKSKRQN
jgi:uncharacterized protein